MPASPSTRTVACEGATVPHPHPIDPPKPARRSVLLRVEPLEPRDVPYSASGNAWPHPELVTVSFQPDGTDLGGVTSNLVSTFNSRFGSAAAWQNAILKAAQAWAQQTNLNFAVVADSGGASGSGAYQQGDPGFGDLRVGGFGFNTGVLALGYMPPEVNNYSVAGDLLFNTAQVFNVNGLDYDLYTVALHEIGHALGLDHSEHTSARMYSTYEGVETGLSADDVAGIRAIYGGARQADRFDAAAPNGSISTATDVSSHLDPVSLTTLLNFLDVTATSDADFFKVVAPADGSGTLRLTVQSTGLSLLAPSVRVYNASQSIVAAKTGSGYLGATLTVEIPVTPGQTYFIRVGGANTSAFGTGAYAMALNFGGGASPVATPPDTQTANGDPMNGGGGVANRRDADGVSVSSLFTTVGNLSSGLGLGLLGDLLGRVNRALVSDVHLPFADVLLAGDPRPVVFVATDLAPLFHAGPGAATPGLAPATSRTAPAQLRLEVQPDAGVSPTRPAALPSPVSTAATSLDAAASTANFEIAAVLGLALDV